MFVGLLLIISILILLTVIGQLRAPRRTAIEKELVGLMIDGHKEAASCVVSFDGIFYDYPSTSIETDNFSRTNKRGIMIDDYQLPFAGIGFYNNATGYCVAQTGNDIIIVDKELSLFVALVELNGQQVFVAAPASTANEVRALVNTLIIRDSAGKHSDFLQQLLNDYL